MSDLRHRVIRLAHARPDLRPHLLPLVAKVAKDAPSDADISDYLEGFSKVLAEAGKSDDEEAHKELLAAYKKLMAALPKDVVAEAEKEAKSKGKEASVRVAMSPILVAAVTSAAVAHKQRSHKGDDPFYASGGPDVFEGLIKAIVAVDEAVRSAGKRLGDAFRSMAQKFSKVHERMERKFGGLDDEETGDRTYKDYVAEQKEKGQRPALDQEAWEARYT